MSKKTAGSASHNLASIYGMDKRQVMEIQFLDVKLVHDEAHKWRQRARAHIIGIRLLRDKISHSRYICERFVLAQELQGQEMAFCQCFGVYRDVARHAMTLDRDYRRQLVKNMARLSGQAA